MKIIHKRVTHEYTVLETMEAGLKLIGAEVKSIRGGHMSLEGSFIKIINNEAFLINAQIFPYQYARPEGYDPKRSRKLLLHKSELLKITTKIQSDKLTVVPLECYTSHGFVKLKIGIARGRKIYEKREKLKKRDMQRDVERDLRGRDNNRGRSA